jgi:hypothetical protein
MKNQNVARRFFAPLLAAAILLAVGPISAQVQERAVGGEVQTTIVPRPAACPAPFSVTLDARTPYVLTSDIGSITNYQTSLNYTKPDKAYLHTFVWKHEHRCCQVTSATMTVVMKAILPGAAINSPDAGNDDISIIHAGVTVPPFSDRIYNGITRPFPAGQTATKTWTLNPAALALLNTNGDLTAYVQDDTSVTSATLQLSGCCLTN